MPYKLIGLAPLLAMAASAAFAAGPDDTQANLRLTKAAAHCDTSGTQDLVFNAACAPAQRAVRVAVETTEPKVRLRAPQAKRITQMPWQTGIFQ